MVENPGAEALDAAGQSRKEKRKALKKQKRKQGRRELAAREREEEEARANDPEEQLRIHLNEQAAAEAAERDRKAFEESERLWLEAAAARRAEEEQKEEEARRKRILEEESQKDEAKETDELGEGDDWEYVEEGPAEIIWKGNEIIVKKKLIRVPRRGADNRLVKEEDDRPTSNPLPPQSIAFDTFNSLPPVSAQEVLDSVAQQVPNFGTEQDKAHCPFHLKTGACRFGARCSRVHFYPDKSCTLLIKNMYNGPGIAWEQDEGLEYTDEEVERCYEEFYEDVHTEFLKFGELVNFKVCRNSSFHLRGNVYIHYKNLESAILAYNTMNGRYYAGKQITCEFVNIARWKIAICGEYMKSRLKTCSHGTACNFIHCFHNPGGDYEWADWDNPPPRYWVKKMDVLFGPCNELRHDMDEELENQQLPRKSNKKRMKKSDGNYCRGARYSETGLSSSSGGDDSDGGRDRYSSRPKRSYSRHRRKSIDFTDKWERSPRDHVPEVDCSDYSRYDVGDDMLKAKDSSSSHKEKKFRDRSVEYHDIHARKRGKSDSRSRSREKIAADGEGKLEKKSKYHGQQKRRHELINSDGSYNKTKDGSQRDGLSSNRANYKLVSDDGEEYNDSPRSADLYSEKGLSYKRHVDSDRFDRCNEFKKSHERSSSKYQSRHRWCYNESKFRKQEANGADLSPIEYLDDWKLVDAKFGEVHNKSVRSSSHCQSDLADSKSLEGSNASLYEHKHERSITRRKRHRKKGEHQDMEEENGDAAL